jgi:hypothetical protein
MKARADGGWAFTMKEAGGATKFAGDSGTMKGISHIELPESTGTIKLGGGSSLGFDVWFLLISSDYAAGTSSFRYSFPGRSRE